MKYDDASWHYGSNFPDDLPPEAGATHIGMFVAWAATAGLIGELHTDDDPDLLRNLLNRSLTPGGWFIAACDEKFTDEDLNAEGNLFAEVYYIQEGRSQATSPKYLLDYCNTFQEHEDVYRVPDSWASFDRLKPVLDRRFSDWKFPPAVA